MGERNIDYSRASDHDLLVQLKITQDMHDKMLHTLFDSIEGNGRPGLKQRVAVLEAKKVDWLNVGLFAVALAGVLAAWFR